MLVNMLLISFIVSTMVELIKNGIEKSWRIWIKNCFHAIYGSQYPPSNYLGISVVSENILHSGNKVTPCTSMSQTYSSFLKDLIRRQSYNAQMESRDKRQINRRSWCCGDSLSSSISSMTKQIRRGLQYGWKMTAQIISLYNGIRGIIALFSPNSSQMQDTQDIVDQLRNKTKQSVFEYLKMIGLN